MNEQEMHYSLYLMAEHNYINAHPDLTEDELFPPDWYRSQNYFLKNKILAEALIKGILVRETERYQKHFIEGVR